MTPDPIITALTARRTSRGMPSAHLADFAGLSRPHWHRIETGACSPRLDTVRRLADALGCELTLTPKGSL